MYHTDTYIPTGASKAEVPSGEASRHQEYLLHWISNNYSYPCPSPNLLQLSPQVGRFDHVDLICRNSETARMYTYLRCCKPYCIRQLYPKLPRISLYFHVIIPHTGNVLKLSTCLARDFRSSQNPCNLYVLINPPTICHYEQPAFSRCKPASCQKTSCSKGMWALQGQKVQMRRSISLSQMH